MQKFRAWNKEEKRWADVFKDSDHFTIVLASNGIFYTIKPYGDGYVDDVLDMNKWDITFSTGKFDKNGKEIFQKDFVLDEYKPEKIDIIEWDEFRSAFRQTDQRIRQGYGISDSKRLIVVGNVFDNPELLKEPI